MIIDHIYKSPTIQTVSRAKNLLGFSGCFVAIRKFINDPVKCDPFLYADRVIEFFLAFYKITDHITRQDPWMTKRKICVGEIIQVLKVRHRDLTPRTRKWRTFGMIPL